MTADKETLENYKYLTSHGVRNIGQAFIQDEDKLNILVNSIPENVLTGFHLYDIFNSTNKPVEIKKKLYETILFNKRFPKSLEISK